MSLANELAQTLNAPNMGEPTMTAQALDEQHVRVIVNYENAISPDGAVLVNNLTGGQRIIYRNETGAWYSALPGGIRPECRSKDNAMRDLTEGDEVTAWHSCRDADTQQALDTALALRNLGRGGGVVDVEVRWV